MGRSDDLAHLPRKRPLELSAGGQSLKRPRKPLRVDGFSNDAISHVDPRISKERSADVSNSSFTPAVPSIEVADVVSSVKFCKVLEPWDLLRGKCVFKQRAELLENLSKARLRHFAPNCSTFSRAREIPIPNVKNPPKPLRSETHPEGIPAELEKLSSKSRRKLDDDTSMADLSANESLEAHKRGDLFTLEHPRRSLAQHLPSWEKLLREEGVALTAYHTCMYEGSRRKKSQMLIHNDERFKTMGLLCQGNRLCDRTGLPHLKWRPTTSGGRVVQFVTGEEREYPKGFCRKYSEIAAEILGEEDKFVEVFSGPNAPLSQELCDLLGTPLPGSRLNTERGVRTELRRLSQLMSGEDQPILPAKAKPVVRQPEALGSRLNMLEANRQPSYGKRLQLIEDGTNSALDHMSKALKLDHPFNTTFGLKSDHKAALEKVHLTADRTNLQRLKVLAEWRSISRSEEVRSLQTEHDKLAGQNAQKLGRRPKTALLQILGKKYGVEDESVPTLLLTGMPIIGPALESPFFQEYQVPAQISILELLSIAKKRRPETMRRVEYMASKGSQSLAEAIYEKTLKEVYKGSMGGPFTEQQMIDRHGPNFNLIPAFGLEQGVDEAGKPKYRRIDDHTAGYTNLAAARKQKIEMAMTDYLVTMVKAMYNTFPSKLTFGSEDMQGAYRQIPLTDKQVMVSITAVWNPLKRETQLFELYGQPFGAAHAVPNFYRVAEYASVLLTRAYSFLLDHFFDDFYYVEREDTSKVAMFCLKQSFELLGLKLDPDKSQPPALVSHILGVQFNSKLLHQEGLLLVEPKPTRKVNFALLVNHILDKGVLPPSVAASVVGKFGFLCSTLFGKVGRFCTGFLRERQYSSSPDHSLTPQLVMSLNLMNRVVQIAPHRTCRMGAHPPPAILYTDASDVPHRDPRFGLGGVLIIQSPCLRIEYFSCTVEQKLVDLWIPKSTYMGQLELLACPAALRTWSKQLSNSQLIHFVDNDSAAAGLVRGYSPRTDSSPLIGDYWLVAAAHGIDVYIDRVESKSNLSDGPSRFDLTEMAALKASFVQCHPPSDYVSPFLLSGNSALHSRLCSLSDTTTS